MSKSVADLRALVVTADPRGISSGLWLAARDRVGDLLMVGPSMTEESDLPTETISLPSIGPSDKYTFRHLRGLSGLIRRYRPDVVHMNNELWAIDSALAALLGTRGLVVHGAENQFQTSSSAGRVRGALSTGVIRRLSGYASWNAAGAEFVRRQAGSSLPTLVLPAIIPPPEFRPNSWSPTSPGQPLTILLIGRLDHQKGFHRVFEAIAHTGDEKAYEVHLCGQGPEEEQLTAMAARSSVKLVKHGHLGTAEVAELMTRMDCLVQPSLTTPSWSEQFGRTVAEAMTVGLPCLVSSSGELPRVVEAPEFVFPEDDSSVLAELLQRFTDHGARAEASRRQLNAAAARWSPESAATALCDFWVRVSEFSHSG